MNEVRSRYFHHFWCACLGFLFLSLLTFLRLICFHDIEVNWYFLLSVLLCFSLPIFSILKVEKKLFCHSFLYFCYDLFYFLGILGTLAAILYFYIFHTNPYNMWNIPALIYTLIGLVLFLLSFLASKEQIKGRAYLFPFLCLTIFEACMAISFSNVFTEFFFSGILSFINLTFLSSLFLILGSVAILFRNHNLFSKPSYPIVGLAFLFCSFFSLNISGFFLGLQEMKR